MPEHPSSAISHPPSCEVSAARLPKPVRITEQVWPEGTVPVVSIKCITYQHVNFIREAIEGFLMQETTFPVEILIHDDASTDGTADIVIEYAAKHPHLFRTILQEENQWSKGIKPHQFINPLVRGEFVAVCEGDDYWTSPHKLQKQVDCLVTHPHASGVFHWVQDELCEGQLQPPPSSSNRDWTLNEVNVIDLLRQNVVTTCSVLFRSAMRPEFLQRYNPLPMGDWPMWIHLALKGPLMCLHERMAVYRFHGQGAWSKRNSFEHATGCAELYPVIADDLPEEWQETVRQRFVDFIKRAATSWLREHEIANFSDAANKALHAIKKAAPLVDSQPGFEEMTRRSIERAVYGLCADRANRAWEQGDFSTARRYFAVLIKSPAANGALRLKWLATFAGKCGLVGKKLLAK